jgi:FkbM family methyltransferase
VYRSWFRTPGSWIFSRRRLAWLIAATGDRTLPSPIRVFARYCRIAPETRSGRLLGAELVYRALSRWARLAGVPDRVRVVTDAHVVHLDLADPRSLVVPGEIADLVESHFLAELLGPGDTFIDIGANHGSFSIVASALVGVSGRIIAVEPQPRLARLVQRSLAENCRCPFTVLQIACADFTGEAAFFVPRRSSGSAGLYKRFSATAATRCLRVPVRPFDDALDWRRLAGRVVMKIDIEGAELAFVRGARRALRHLRPVLVLELNPAAARGGAGSLDDLVSELRALGYECVPEGPDLKVRDARGLAEGRSRNVVVAPRAV